jgi:hypothetical protein
MTLPASGQISVLQAADELGLPTQSVGTTCPHAGVSIEVMGKMIDDQQGSSTTYNFPQDGFYGYDFSGDCIAAFDARDARSKKSGVSTWYDLSGNENNMTILNSPLFYTNANAAGGSFYFYSSNYGTLSGLNNENETIASTGLTIEIWSQRTSGTNAQYLWDARGTNGQSTGYMLTEYAGYDWNWANAVRYNSSNGYNNWHQWAISMSPTFNEARGGYPATGYLNGTSVATGYQSQTPALPNTFYMGKRFSGTGYLTGYVQIFKIYSKQLSAKQIQGSYDFYKGRFGLT